MGRKKPSSLDFRLDSETRRSVSVICLFAFAIVLLLGIFQAGGAAGRWLDEGLSQVFGWDKLFLPFFLMAWGYHVAAPDRLLLRVKNVIGIFLFFLSLNPLVHLIAFPGSVSAVGDRAIRAAGGKLGEVLATLLLKFLGFAGSLTIFVALFILAILLLFNLTMADVRSLLEMVKKIGIFLLHIITWPVKQLMRVRTREAPAEQIHFGDVHEVAASPSILTNDSLDEDTSETEEDEGDEGVETLDEEDEGDEILPPPKPKKRYPKIEIPFDLLERRDQKPTSGDINHNREVIRRTLEKFGIPVEMADVSIGPTVTQFTLKPSDGVKLARITSLHNDLALALAAHPIRIEAPIPGKSLVGLEVPNQSVATVGLREILESREFRERKPGGLHFVLGKDVSGKPWTADLGRMPHMLVAGATGSGKSVCLNTIIMSFLYTHGPDELKFVMVDPKRVELQVYNGLPHLVTPVITKVPETVNALKWALREMDHRYDLLSKFGARDLASYNARVEERIPYLVMIIDELADLMATSAAEIEGPIVRLAQMARAVGIHLILATQRPSVDVITGLIKANIPARIAFAVASSTDSRTILDQQGAEKLIGRGDMLFSTAELATPKRVQGAFVSDQEISRVMEFIKSKYDPADYDYSVTERPTSRGAMGGEAAIGEDDDPLIPDAKEEILRAGKASASLLQRRLKVGYARAARLLDLLENEGFIGPADGAKPREILKADFTKSMENSPTPRSAPSEASEEEEESSTSNEEEEREV